MFFFFNDTATTEIYTLSLHDALPIFVSGRWFDPYGGETYTDPSDIDVDHIVPPANAWRSGASSWDTAKRESFANVPRDLLRSEEHTSELQSRQYLVCRLLLEKKNTFS